MGSTDLAFRCNQCQQSNHRFSSAARIAAIAVAVWALAGALYLGLGLVPSELPEVQRIVREISSQLLRVTVRFSKVDPMNRMLSSECAPYQFFRTCEAAARSSTVSLSIRLVGADPSLAPDLDRRRQCVQVG